MEDSVKELRKLFLEDPDICKNYDLRDVNIVKSSDIPCIGFLETNPSTGKALESMRNHFKWRKAERVNDLAVTDFPKEVYKLNWIYTSSNDLAGRPILWMRLAVPIGAKSLLLKYFTLTMEIIRNLSIDRKIKPAVIYDCRDPSIDIYGLKELINISLNQYPAWVEYIVFLEMNSTYAFFCKALKYFFPKYLRDNIKFLSTHELLSLVSQDNFPNYMGGQIETIESKAYQCCPSFEDYARLHSLEPKEADKIKRYFDVTLPMFSINIPT